MSNSTLKCEANVENEPLKGWAQPEVPERTPTRRHDVDGLRAVAVVMVVLFHMHSCWCPGGFIGVDVFFVISGFVVCTSLLQRTSVSTVDYFLSFAARRVKRLLPVALFVVAIAAPALVAVAPLSFSADVSTYLKVATAGLLGNANNWLYMTADSYLDPEKEGSHADPFLHLWSLGVEEQFYVVFPLLFLLGLGSQAAEDVPWEASHARLWSLLGVAATGSLVVCCWWGLHDSDAAFYLLPARFWELAAGAALALCAQDPHFKELMQSPRLSLVLQALGLLLLAAALLFLRTQGAVGFPFPGALLPVTAAVLLIASGCRSEPMGLSNVLAAWLPSYVGRLSYSIYLWHMPALAARYWWVSTREVSSPEAFATLLLAPLLVCLLAAFTYHRIEIPLEELRAESFTVVIAGAAGTALVQLWVRLVRWLLLVDFYPRADELALCLAAVVVFVLVGYHSLDWVRNQPPSLRVAGVAVSLLLVPLAGLGLHQVAVQDACSAMYMHTHAPVLSLTPTAAAQCIAQPCACRKQAALHQPPCALQKGGFPQLRLPPCFDATKRHSGWAMNSLGPQMCDCHSEKRLCLTDPMDAYSCLTRKRGSEQSQVILLGDSKAWQLLPAFKRIFQQERFRFFTWSAAEEPAACLHAVPAVEKALGPGDVVILTTIACKQVDECISIDSCGFETDFPSFFSGGDRWYQDLLEALIRTAAQRNATLLLLEANPMVPPSGKLTLDQQKCRSDLCRTAWTRAQRAANVSKQPLTMSYSDLLCNGDHCGTRIPCTAVPLKADLISHLTIDAVEYLFPFLCSRFSNLGLAEFLQKPVG